MEKNNTGSLKSLKDEQQVRQRPQVIFGTNDEHGCAHGIYEIIANAIDEAREGYGDEIIIDIRESGEVSVEDFGRGIPMDWNAGEQKFDWELAFCTLYASGKYDDAIYGQSLGLNGLGLTAMQFASEYMVAESVYNGKLHTVQFKKGRPTGEMQVIKNPYEKVSGTKITFKPDPEVFIGIKKNALPPEHYINLLRRQAMLHPGLKIVFRHFEVPNELVLKYDNGVVDFVDAITERPMIKTAYFSGSDFGTDDIELYPEQYKVDMRIAFNFSRLANLTELYHNGSHLYEGGSTAKGLESAITRAFIDHAKEVGKLSRNDKFLYKDIESILVCVASTDAPGNRTFFKNQTKAAITNEFIGRAFGQFVYNNVRNWLKNEKTYGAKVLEEVITNKKAREEADKVSKKVVQSLSKTVAFGDEPEGFYDCKSKNSLMNELYIVEGKSALGSTVTARFPDFQAVIAVRGKVINCLKEQLTRVLNSDVIISLFRVLGCGIEAKSKHIDNLPEFNINNLKYNKIIICTDADLDGMQIRCLLITMFYVLAPTLLKQGKVYIAETPLFEVTYKDETYFCYTEQEKEDACNKLMSRGINMNKVTIQRSKGLGENTAQMMHDSTMNPTTRRLIPVDYHDGQIVADTFNALLGPDIENRRMLIDHYFSLTEADID